MRVELGPERMILSDGLQPFMIQTAKGTLFVQAQLRFYPGYVAPERDPFPGIPGNVISRDEGKTWTRWIFKDKQEKVNEGVTETLNHPTAPATSVESGKGATALATKIAAPSPVMNQPGDALAAIQGPIFEGAAVQLRDGPILMMEWVAPEGPDAQGWWGGRVWESHDDLETFDGPIYSRIYLPEGTNGINDHGVPYSGLTFHGAIVELPNGDLLAPIYCVFKEDTILDVTQVKPAPKGRSVLMRSSDRARTWHFVSTIAVDSTGTVTECGFLEPSMARVSRGPHAGRLVCHLRTGNLDWPMFQAHSDDDGATWSKPHTLQTRGVNPDIIELADGSLAAIHGRRIFDDPDLTKRGYYLVISRDAGQTWKTVAQWSVEPYAVVPHSTYYGCLRELSPGRLLVVYDVGFWMHPIRYVASRELRLIL